MNHHEKTIDQYTNKDKAPRAVQIVFVVVCALVITLPALCMVWVPTNSTTENRELAQFPSAVDTQGSLNVNFLSDLGAYFEDHYAFKNELVAANAHLYAAAFSQSSTDSVIVGTDGWLYYSGTLDNYLGNDTLSERAASNIAFNLSLIQGYCQAKGSDFVFTMAPNKNTLYPQNMPYFYGEGAGSANFDVLNKYLDTYGVNYIDAYQALSDSDEPMYYMRDTHWNTKAAMYINGLILSKVGDIFPDELVSDFKEVDYIGDLNSMLYSVLPVPETDLAYSNLVWKFSEGGSVEDSFITTQSLESGNAGQAAQANGSLYMFRDSFANNMIGGLASAYDTATFSKLLPYDLAGALSEKPSVIVIERAERHISQLNTDPGIMLAPSVSLSNIAEGAAKSCDVELVQDGDYIKVYGSIEALEPDDDSPIYLYLSKDGATSLVVAYRVNYNGSDYGFLAYLDSAIWGDLNQIKVIYTQDGELLSANTTYN